MIDKSCHFYMAKNINLSYVACLSQAFKKIFEDKNLPKYSNMPDKISSEVTCH